MPFEPGRFADRLEHDTFIFGHARLAPETTIGVLVHQLESGEWDRKTAASPGTVRYLVSLNSLSLPDLIAHVQRGPALRPDQFLNQAGVTGNLDVIEGHIRILKCWFKSAR
jgi:hypothetical protein